MSARARGGNGRDLDGRAHRRPAEASAFQGLGTQGIAFSHDRGRTWTKYSGKPVLPAIHPGTRDPNVQWYDPQKKWAMALYLDPRASTDFSAPEDDGYALFSSKDLKTCEKLCDVTLRDDGECPNFFEIPVYRSAGETRWIFSGARRSLHDRRIRRQGVHAGVWPTCFAPR
jgi:sucrose-6-phosphate hydrolase SacC (GH32 family)